MGLFAFAEKSDKPKFKKISQEGCVVTASIDIPEALIEDERHNTLVRIQGQAKIPGFRPGKAPMALLEAQLSGALKEDILDKLADRFVPELLKELNLRPVSTCVVKPLEWNKSLKVEVKVETAPQFSVKDYFQVPVAVKSRSVTDDAVAAELEKLREAHSRLEKAPEEALGKEHYAVIGYAAFKNGRPFEKLKSDSELVDMSSDQLLDGLSEGLLGMKRGESKDVSVKLRGQPLVLKASLIEIKRKVVPNLDEELAKDAGVESLDELKNGVRRALEENAKKESEEETWRQISAALLKSHPIPLPPSLVEEDVERFIRRLSEKSRRPLAEAEIKKLKQEIRPRVEDELRLSYVFSAVADKEKLEAAKEEVDREIESVLGEVESEGEKERLRKSLEKKRDEVSRVIRERKARALVRERAAVQGQA